MTNLDLFFVITGVPFVLLCKRFRSFVLGTPGGARTWKRATSSTQGTPWAGRVQQRSTPVRQKALLERGLGRSGPWGNTPSKNGLETPAELTRRIMSVLEDLGTPVSLHPVR